MSNLNYWYHAQLRLYLLQFIRVFEGFQIRTGIGQDGSETYIKVPIRYSDMSRQVGHILRDNTANMILSCPFMTCHMSGINMAPDRRQVPNHVSQVQVTERYYDAEAGVYTGEIGQTYSIDRYMPVPYDVTMELDIWTSNTDQKLQLLEQILVLFNPSIDLQTSVNPVDWTALTVIELQDSISWSDRSIPAGTDESMDIAKLTFKMPIWLSPPAKVKRQKIINQIVTNLTHTSLGDPDVPQWNGDSKLDTRLIISPRQNSIKVQGNTVTLLDYAGGNLNPEGNPFVWKELLDRYGHMHEGHSLLHLRTGSDLDDQTSIVGTIKFHKDDNKLTWTIDPETIPKNTLADFDAIIDPHRTYPGQNLPPATKGQRYLLIDEIGPCEAWGDLNAQMNDIIEFNGEIWGVSFDSNMVTDAQFAFNRHPKSQKQYKWTGQEWIEVINGEYYPGYWWVTL